MLATSNAFPPNLELYVFAITFVFLYSYINHFPFLSFSFLFLFFHACSLIRCHIKSIRIIQIIIWGNTPTINIFLSTLYLPLNLAPLIYVLLRNKLSTQPYLKWYSRMRLTTGCQRYKHDIKTPKLHVFCI